MHENANVSWGLDLGLEEDVDSTDNDDTEVTAAPPVAKKRKKSGEQQLPSDKQQKIVAYCPKWVKKDWKDTDGKAKFPWTEPSPKLTQLSPLSSLFI